MTSFYGELFRTIRNRSENPHYTLYARKLFTGKNLFKSFALIFGVGLIMAVLRSIISKGAFIVMAGSSSMTTVPSNIDTIFLILRMLSIAWIFLLAAVVCVIAGLIILDFRWERRNGTFEFLMLSAVNPRSLLLGFLVANVLFLVRVAVYFVSLICLLMIIITALSWPKFSLIPLFVLAAVILTSLALAVYFSITFLRFSMRFESQWRIYLAAFLRIMLLVGLMFLLAIGTYSLMLAWRDYQDVIICLFLMSFPLIIFFWLPVAFRGLEKEFARHPRD